MLYDKKITNFLTLIRREVVPFRPTVDTFASGYSLLVGMPTAGEVDRRSKDLCAENFAKVENKEEIVILGHSKK